MMIEVIAGRNYVPARGQRIPMPGNQPDWPLDGRPVDPLNLYELRMVRDGDLVLKTETGKGAAK
jgi:hypothetical protein